MKSYVMISDAAKEVNVESHVLRYWEEELKLPIKRNELGHRYYTQEDIVRFKEIKRMKEKGLQLKAIRMILLDGKLQVIEHREKEQGMPSFLEAKEKAVVEKEIIEEVTKEVPEETGLAINIIGSRELSREMKREEVESYASREEKAKRLQWLLQQMIRQSLQENNKELCREIKESIEKELDYQFRAQEEREETRERIRDQRTEEYYKRMDELLRKKSNQEKKVFPKWKHPSSSKNIKLLQ